MKRPLCLMIFLFAFALPVMAQSGPEIPFERLQDIAIQPAKADPETGSVPVPEMLPLFQEEEIRYTGGKKYKDALLKFRLHVPDKMESGKKYPLILWLHGVGEAGDDNSSQLIHLHHLITYLTGPKKRDFFLLVPQTPEDHTGWDAYSYYLSTIVDEDGNELQVAETSEGGEEFGDSPLGYSFAMLEQTCKKYPVDRDRITVSGLSSGGDGTWRALERGPDIFAAAVPLVSWNAITDKEIQKSPILKKIPIWAIYSSDDRGIDYAREEFARVEAAGCNVNKSEFGLCGHNAWTPAMLQADIFSWLLSRGKKDGKYIAVEDSSIDPAEMKGIIEVAERDSRLPTLAPPKDASQPAAQAARTAPSVPAPPAAVASVSDQLMPQRAVGQMQMQGMQGMSMQGMGMGGMNSPFVQPVEVEIDQLRTQLAIRYFMSNDREGVARIFQQLRPEAKMSFLRIATLQAKEPQLEFVETLLNEVAAPAPRTHDPRTAIPAQAIVFEGEEEQPLTVSSSVRYVVEECEKEWEMSTQTLYGLFAVNWDKESELVPDFVRNSTAKELVLQIANAVGKGGDDFQKLCDSVLKLENQPMSSPWFETSGGRLQSDIKYSLSGRGKILQAVFLDLSKGDLTASKKETIKKVLQKMDVILGKK